MYATCRFPRHHFEYLAPPPHFLIFWGDHFQPASRASMKRENNDIVDEECHAHPLADVSTDLFFQSPEPANTA